MNIARPRLLAASLAVAAVVIVGAVAFAVQSGNGDDEVDAHLTDTGGVVTFPGGDLENGNVRGEPLPLVAVGDSDGNEILTASFIGEPLVINFWFSTCVPCAKELPDFAEVHAERGDDVRFIGINPRDSAETMDRFAGERGVQYELYLDDFADFTDAIRASSFPITLFVTAEGGVVGQTGPIDADELRAEIDKLLEEAA